MSPNLLYTQDANISKGLSKLAASLLGRICTLRVTPQRSPPFDGVPVISPVSSLQGSRLSGREQDATGTCPGEWRHRAQRGARRHEGSDGKRHRASALPATLSTRDSHRRQKLGPPLGRRNEWARSARWLRCPRWEPGNSGGSFRQSSEKRALPNASDYAATGEGEVVRAPPATTGTRRRSRTSGTVFASGWGSATVNVLPLPGSLSTLTVPP